MNTIFENKCVYTYDYYLQLKRKTMDKGATSVGWVLLIVFLGLSVFTIAKGWYMFAIAAVIGVLLISHRLFIIPVMLAKFAARKNREIHGKDVETVNIFYEDHILAVNTLTMGKTSIEYTEVKQLLETRDLYIIGMDKGLVLMIDKNGFTKGSREDFTAFMREKCENAEVKI